MNAKQAKRTIGIVQAALAELRDLRWHRTGRHTASQLREELEAFNRGIAAGNTMLLRQKLEWFHHDSIRRELGNIQAVLRQLYPFLNEASVQQQIRYTGYEPGKIMHHFAHSLEWVEKLRSVVDAHESLVKQVLAGSPAEHSMMTKLEDRILRLNDWEERVARLCKGAVAEVKYHPAYATLEEQEARDPSLFQRVIGAFMTRIVLPIAAASAGMFLVGTQAYAQDVAKNEPKQQEVVKSIDDQILLLEAKQNKSPEETLALAQLYVKADKPAKADEILRAYLKENPNDIRALVQKRNMDEKKGLHYPDPDDEVNRIIDAYDHKKYGAMIKERNFKGIIAELEPNLNKLCKHNLQALTPERKAKADLLFNVLGAAYDMTEQGDHALQSALESIRINPNGAGSYGIVAKILRSKGQNAEALPYYTKVAELQPRLYHGHIGMARCYTTLGKFEQALPCFKKAVEAAPANLKDKFQKELDDCGKLAENK
jgi:tetratricopeptide (TPR) repeat protein